MANQVYQSTVFACVFCCVSVSWLLKCICTGYVNHLHQVLPHPHVLMPSSAMPPPHGEILASQTSQGPQDARQTWGKGGIYTYVGCHKRCKTSVKVPTVDCLKCIMRRNPMSMPQTTKKAVVGYVQRIILVHAVCATQLQIVYLISVSSVIFSGVSRMSIRNSTSSEMFLLSSYYIRNWSALIILYGIGS